jgi:phosphatidate cytidylyltransferase
MKRVLTAVVLIPIVLAIIFKGPFCLFAAAVGIVAVLSYKEFICLLRGVNVEPLLFSSVVLGIILFSIISIHAGGWDRLYSETHLWYGTATWLLEFQWASPLYVVFACILLALGMTAKNPRDGMIASCAAIIGIVYILNPFALLLYLHQEKSLIVFVLIIVWVGDAAAYYVGKNIGQHKLAVTISPGKTWEGAIASTVAAAAVGAIAVEQHTILGQSPIDWFHSERSGIAVHVGEMVVFSICINVAAQLGDLVESAFKRAVGVKDSGSLLPGHGGMLDRIDALLFAIPVAYYYAAYRTLIFHAVS